MSLATDPVLPPLAREFLDAALPGHAPFTFERLAGGASPRRFYRIGCSGSKRVVLMVVPENTPDVAKARELGRAWPFLELRDLLESRGVRVPALFGADTAAGLLAVEDLGETLAEHLARAPAERARLYRLAVRELAQAQRALAALPEDSIVLRRAFDFELLHWEIQHYREWGLEGRGVELGASACARFDAAAGALAQQIAALPRGFVHRDYQSRNLMVCEGTLGWIDFQDALLGPRAYDLVALLCDSYQPFERGFVEACLDEYASAAGLDARQRGELGREFDLITVQRKLKDAGRFVFIARDKGDPSFLPYFEPTLSIVRQALERLRDEPAVAALSEFVP